VAADPRRIAPARRVTDPLLAAALRAAERAGEAIMKIYADDFAVHRKNDATPVTEADVAAERVIMAILGEAFPEIPIVSEEMVSDAGLPPASDRFWLVDPLDGTKEFIARNGEFAVLIALVENGWPSLGVIHGPSTGVTYFAHGPGTAMRRRNGGAAEAIGAREPGPQGISVVHSRSHENSRRLAEYFEDKPVRERAVCGSALKFGMLAAGEADLYPRFGTTMEWDTGAGQAVLEAAGGHVDDLSGARLRYGKPGLKNDGFLAWGRRRVW
jgi:3'(2'), 5'-bisphosphate nucleotidase